MAAYDAPQFQLSGVAGEYARQQIPLSATPLIIGKDSRQANLIVSDKLISRMHCQLSVRQGQVALEDLNSSNGTFVNDVRMQPRQVMLLRDGDLVSLAGSLIFRMVAVHAAAGETIVRPPPDTPPQPQPAIQPPASHFAGHAVDLRKVAQLLVLLGGVITICAILWWAIFYGSLINKLNHLDDSFWFRQINQELNITLKKAVPCLYSNAGLCNTVVSVAQLAGKTPYNPILLWVGIGLLGVGGMLWLALRKTN